MLQMVLGQRQLPRGDCGSDASRAWRHAGLQHRIRVIYIHLIESTAMKYLMTPSNSEIEALHVLLDVHAKDAHRAKDACLESGDSHKLCCHGLALLQGIGKFVKANQDCHDEHVCLLQWRACTQTAGVMFSAPGHLL